MLALSNQVALWSLQEKAEGHPWKALLSCPMKPLCKVPESPGGLKLLGFIFIFGANCNSYPNANLTKIVLKSSVKCLLLGWFQLSLIEEKQLAIYVFKQLLTIIRGLF